MGKRGWKNKVNYEFTADITDALNKMNALIDAQMKLQEAQQKSQQESKKAQSQEKKDSEESVKQSEEKIAAKKKESDEVDKLKKAVKGIAAVYKEFFKINAKTVASVLTLSNAFKTSKKSVSAFSDILGKVAGITAGVSIGKMLADSAKSAIDMVEVINLFNVAMKDSLATGRKFITTMSEMYGLDPTNLMKITGLFYEMGAAVEVPAKVASDLALDLTKLSLNVSSLFNIPIEQVADNMTSGIRGMSKAVVKYGMDLRATTVEAYANSIGITENFETMNEASRVLLRFIVMARQARDANNDFAETLESPANQLRVLKEQVIQLGRVIGRYLVQAFKDVIPVLNGIVMAIRLVLETIADFFGVFSGESDREIEDVTDNVSSGISGIGDSAADTTKKLNKMLAPFDELNIISEEASSAAAGGAGGAGLGSDLIDPRILAELDKVNIELEEVRTKMHEVRDSFLEFFGLEYELKINPDTGEVISKLNVIPGQFADQLIKAIEAENWDLAGTLIAKKLNTVLSKIPSQLSWSNLGPQIASKLTPLIGTINAVVRELDWYSIGQTFGTMLTTAFRTIEFVSDNFDWSSLGTAIASSLNGFFAGYNLTSLGGMAASILNGAATAIKDAAGSFNWSLTALNIANGINRFLEKLKPADFAKAAQNILHGLASSIETFFEKVDWEVIPRKLREFLINIDWIQLLNDVGNAVMAGFAAGITLAWATLEEALKLLCDAIVAAVKGFLGIHSPSKVFSDIGVDIVLGIPEGIGKKIGEVLTWINNNVVAPLTDKFSGIATNISTSAENAVKWFKEKFDGIGEWFTENVTDPIGVAMKNGLNFIIGGFEGFVNALIDGINWLIRKINLISFDIPEWVPVIGGNTWGFNLPTIGKVSIPRLATGGVITSPTQALIGEGLYDEAVIPLGNSPQLEQMLSRFADVVAAQPGGGETVVKVYIGEREWDAFTYESAQRGEKIVGRKPIREGT